LPLPAHTVAELRAHWRAQREQRLALGLGKAPGDAIVLATFDGKPQSPNSITKAWQRAIKAIGMPKAGLHSLRHTHVSMLLASGMDILTISRRIGHASVAVTLDVYGHLIHGTDDRAAAIMDAALGSSPVAEGVKKPEISR
jgi:integrase